MNETIRNIITRRSVKSYTSQMPPLEMIREICQAGTYAPTGMGAQSPLILAVTDKAMRDRLSRINLDIVMGHNLTTTSGHSDPFYGAPVVLVVLAEKARATRVYDGSLVMANLMLATHSLGLGSCWIHRAKETYLHYVRGRSRAHVFCLPNALQLLFFSMLQATLDLKSPLWQGIILLFACKFVFLHEKSIK